eukprot:gb/GECG01010723.1/.p1 GENE.gb/GECG01010723.1/~~gb/GECG01010723.1/.p1  ORF type:complete len:576 (+),score=103.01 gb/GECG01010723.1/:1-1728(+)
MADTSIYQEDDSAVFEEGPDNGAYGDENFADNDQVLQENNKLDTSLMDTSTEHLPTKKLSFNSIQETPFRKIQRMKEEEDSSDDDDEKEEHEEREGEEEDNNEEEGETEDENRNPEETQGLQENGKRQRTTTTKTDGSTSEADSENQKALEVFLRIRPRVTAEAGVQSIFSVANDRTIGVKAPQESVAHRERGNQTYFTFNRVFDENASQGDLFTEVVRPKVDSCVADGKNLLLFAYGMTNSGKTYTIAGTETSPGLLPRTLSHLFRTHLASEEETERFSVEVSYCEIYNEQLFDLLSGARGNNNGGNTLRRAPPRGGGGGSSNSLKIRQDKEGRTYVQGLRNLKVSDARTALSLFAEGQKNKHMAETSLNRDSSRSHAIFTITVFDSHTNVSAQNRKVQTRINLVDLAGSERARRTQATGTALKEAGKINNSLSVLGRCLDSLRNNSNQTEVMKRIPFRESRLTELFSDHLAGAKPGYTIMLLNTGPAPLDYDETMQALKYGVSASEIRVTATRTSISKESNLYNYDGHRIRKGGKGSTAGAPKPAITRRTRAQKRSLMNSGSENEEPTKKTGH